MTSPRLNAFQDELNAADSEDAKSVRLALVGSGHYGCARRVRKSIRGAIFAGLLICLIAVSAGTYVLVLRGCDAAISGPVWIP